MKYKVTYQSENKIPFAHFSLTFSVTGLSLPIQARQDAHLLTTELELLCNTLFIKLKQGLETPRIT